MAQSRRYSGDKMMMRQAEWDISKLATTSPRPLMKIEPIIPGNNSRHFVIYIQK
jgi:hypothetical protein